jgi:hypothetical protein
LAQFGTLCITITIHFCSRHPYKRNHIEEGTTQGRALEFTENHGKSIIHASSCMTRKNGNAPNPEVFPKLKSVTPMTDRKSNYLRLLGHEIPKISGQ